jgi:hypothetical protein
MEQTLQSKVPAAATAAAAAAAAAAAVVDVEISSQIKAATRPKFPQKSNCPPHSQSSSSSSPIILLVFLLCRACNWKIADLLKEAAANDVTPIHTCLLPETCLI